MLAENLKYFRKEMKYTQRDIANHLGITQQAVGRWESGDSAPNPETLVILAGLLRVSVDSLLGRNAPFTPGIPPYRPAVEAMVPIIGSVRAGYGALAFEEDYGSEPAGVKDPENYFYLVVKGDSMEPRIQDGDLALVRKQPILEDGELGVVIFGENEGTLKRFKRRGNAILLQPFNPAYETVVVAGEALEHLHVAGKVVETKIHW